MELLKIILCLLVLASHGHGEVRKKVIDMTKIFLKKISSPDGYNRDVMPLNPNGGPVNVGISAYIRNIELDDTKMQVRVDMTFRMRWQDTRLAFSDSPDVDYLRFTDYTKIWVPDPFFTNSDATEMHKSVHPEAFVRVQSDGHVLFSTRMKLKVDCPMDFSRFPHDSQQCTLKMASYGYTTSDLILEMAEESVPISEEIVSKNRFDLISVNESKCEDTSTTTGNYSCLSFTLKLDRTSSTYICEWYLPCCCLVIIAFLSHLISSDNLLIRILLTLGPLLCLISCSVLYGKNLLRFGQPTAIDVYTGISVTVVFLTLLHVIVFYYYSSMSSYVVGEEGSSEPKGEEPPKGTTKKEKCVQLVKEKGDVISRVTIIGFYCIFIFLYLIAYVP